MKKLKVSKFFLDKMRIMKRNKRNVKVVDTQMERGAKRGASLQRK